MRGALEVELRPKLELSSIVRCGRTAEEPAIIRALSERIHVGKEGRSRAFVEAIEHIEHLADYVEADTLAETKGPGHAKVDRSKAVGQAHVAS